MAGIDLGADGLEALGDGGAVVLGDDAALGEHRGMGQGAGNILAIKPFIHIDRRVNLLHHRRGAGGETPAPHAGYRFVGSCCGRF